MKSMENRIWRQQQYSWLTGVEIVPFEVESLSGLSPFTVGLSPSRDWVLSGLSPFRGWVPLGLCPTWDWVLSGLNPFRVESIQGWVYSGLSPFGVEFMWGWVHSGLGPFRVQSIWGWVHLESSLSRFCHSTVGSVVRDLIGESLGFISQKSIAHTMYSRIYLKGTVTWLYSRFDLTH
jgi:hypothetical protein